MNQFELYYFPSCPFCQLVLQALPGMNVDVKLKNIMEDFDYRNELLAGGGKTQVPCLKIISQDGEQWMYESQDIVSFLKQQ